MITWEYVAGFLDGDGWITSSKNKNCSTKSYTIGFTQIFREYKFMKILYKFLTDNGISGCMFERVVKESIKKETKMINIMIKEQRSVVFLLKKLMPNLIIKKQKAEWALLYVKDRLKKRGYGLENNLYKQRYWTDEENKKLEILIKNGYSSLAIANILNRSIDSILQKAHRLGIKWHKPLACHGDVLIELIK